jgi:RNA polymerase sigma-70 factor (ECF subfamily)
MEDDLEGREQALVKRALDDPLAFQELYENYFSRIYGYVASRINNQQDAEDVVSEVFLRVIRNLAALRNQHPTSFAAWLFAVARNVITDHYRRKEHTESVIPFDSPSPLIAQAPHPDTDLIGSEEAAQLRDLIATLPERKREIVTLKYYGGLRNQEIAVMLQIGEKTVAAYLSRALDELHEKYTNLKSESEQKVVGHDS